MIRLRYYSISVIENFNQKLNQTIAFDVIDVMKSKNIGELPDYLRQMIGKRLLYLQKSSER